jgi:hypothetical protein
VPAVGTKAPPEPQERTLTAGEVAAMISRPTDTALTLTRVRFWTAEGLLHTAGGPDGLHTGVGKHRRYDLASVLDVAASDTR